MAPAIRLRRLSELRAMLEEVTSTALIAAMADARGEGWGLRKIGASAGISHEQARRTLAEGRTARAEQEGGNSAGGGVRSCPSRTSSGRGKL
ncbi:hypothetical protein [Streptosporangium sp. KLBMP 9127]|nr:hypothetical protein [Streptosporangium sp. KLBMP 9127]